VARAAHLPRSDDASFVTGHTLAVDGGTWRGGVCGSLLMLSAIQRFRAR